MPYNSANSVVSGNEASVTLNVHGVVFRYMYTQSLSGGSLYMACVSDTLACSKIAQGNLNISTEGRNTDVHMHCACDAMSHL